MNSFLEVFFLFTLTFYITSANPIVIKGSSPSGDAIIAISSSDPEVEKFLRFGFSSELGTNQDSIVTSSVEDIGQKSVTVGSLGQQSETGTGRSFVSTSSFNPFLLPLFFMPLNFEGIGLGDFGSLNNDRLKGVESFIEPNLGGTGEIKAVAAISDNGRVYGNIKTVTFDNKGIK
ncbi:uncharacterized protein LOC113518437 [Galleria mellonella]|uniref:Uncharacterized protein LOC113518437 n=1 Tax=Galleria mellonella TaxID=7137 RepID=A0A6J1WTI4_GALME|nr:uncharacterized protein LOC113518437 [Galleria mellonella]